MSTSYKPSSVSPPGATLADLLEEKSITQRELGLRIERSEKLVSQVIHGKAPISVELALQLEQALGVPARFWIDRESRYREHLARQHKPAPAQEDLEWTKNFPYSEMAGLGCVKPSKNPEVKFSELLKFFASTSIAAYLRSSSELQVQFRRSELASAQASKIAVWLRMGEIMAESKQANKFNERAFSAAVVKARALTSLDIEDSIPRLLASFAECGVILIFVRELSGLGVSGATRWLSPDRALIQVSLRYKTSDQLWFTIFHEACHVLRHSRKGIHMGYGDSQQEEDEANDFSANLLIPKRSWRRFVEKRNFSESSVLSFAQFEGISPGIVVGRLQKEKYILFSQLNHLKVKLEWPA